jgi:serine protease
VAGSTRQERTLAPAASSLDQGDDQVAKDRAHQIRVVVQPAGTASVATVRSQVELTLGRGWQVQRFLTRPPQYLVIGGSDAPVGTNEHARASHDAALALHRSRRFAKAEADVPVPGFADPDAVGAFGDDQCGDDSEDLDWTHRLVHWAEAMELMSPAARGGAGVRIGHPDSGYTLHPNLGAAGLDLDRDRDVIDGDDDALDDLEPNPHWPLPNPGHGTSTASVIVGRGAPSEGIVGFAPDATLVPIRATESVVQLFDSDVAEAVSHARKVGCHVVSMSLGGKGFFGLEREIKRAVDSGMIVMAAAGNKVGIVTAPASYRSCIAVAATGPGDSLWDGSSRGSAVDVAMPGASVHNASFKDRAPRVSRSHGTSYAVAHLAGAAALWLAHHGHDHLVASFGAKRIQAAFLATLRWPDVCVVPSGWDEDWGIGRVDLLALLQAPLPRREDLDQVSAFGAGDDPIERLAAVVGANPVLVRTRLTAVLGLSTPEELAALLDAHAGELVYLAMRDDAFVSALTEPAAAGAFGTSAPDVGGLSGELAAMLGG